MFLRLSPVVPFLLLFFFIFSPSFFTSSPPFLCKFILTYSLIACQIFGIKFALRTAAHRVVNLPNSTANPCRPRRHCHCQCHRIPLGLCYTFALCHCHTPMPLVSLRLPSLLPPLLLLLFKNVFRVVGARVAAISFTLGSPLPTSGLATRLRLEDFSVLVFFLTICRGVAPPLPPQLLHCPCRHPEALFKFYFITITRHK